MLGQQGTTSVLLVEVEFVVLDVVADVVEDAPVDAAHGGGGIEVTCGVVLFVDVLQIGWNGTREFTGGRERHTCGKSRRVSSAASQTFVP